MADPNLLDLARLAITLPGWRWMPGMRALPQLGRCALPIRLGDERHPSYPDEYDWPHDLGLRLPDLSDPATKGCLLALAREHQRRPNLCVVAMSHCRSVESDAVLAWFVFNKPMSGDGDPPEFLDPDGRWGSDSRCAAWQTKVDALVAALGESDE